ncbi:MAG: WecB/TagA/CpsF family glycosyltransferase [Hyphomicrobiaceae bacterium]
MHTKDDDTHMNALSNADMVTPDGTPLVWVARMRGCGDMSRVCGPDLLPAVCAHSETMGWRHYFYGGAAGVAEDLAERLRAQFPRLQIAGTECPPFRPLRAEEETALLKRLADARADIIWVGLGCPKQERWMREHVRQIQGTVLIGIGAAFDYHTGRINRAPKWMRNTGLEWLHRLGSEPRRLWRRYVLMAPRFVWHSTIETLSRSRSSATRHKAEQ